MNIKKKTWNANSIQKNDFLYMIQNLRIICSPLATMTFNVEYRETIWHWKSIEDFEGCWWLYMLSRVLCDSKSSLFVLINYHPQWIHIMFFSHNKDLQVFQDLFLVKKHNIIICELVHGMLNLRAREWMEFMCFIGKCFNYFIHVLIIVSCMLLGQGIFVWQSL